MMNLFKKYISQQKNKHPLCETIRIENGLVQNLEWHQKRYVNSYNSFYGKMPVNKLLENEIIPKRYRKGIVKLRIIYNSKEKIAVYEKYTIKEIRTLKLVFDNTINYDLKYTNRRHLNMLYNKREKYDDILIIKNGIITDSFYTNIVFFDGLSWTTPSTPLLKGTARERLIKSNFLREQKISINCLKKFKSFKLINAMRDFETVAESEITNIQA